MILLMSFNLHKYDFEHQAAPYMETPSHKNISNLVGKSHTTKHVNLHNKHILLINRKIKLSNSRLFDKFL